MEYPAVSPRLAGFGFPLKDYAAKPAKTWLPHCGSLDEFLNPPLHSAFCSVRSATLSPYAGGRPKRSISLTDSEIHKRAGILATRVCHVSCPPVNPA
jgi:hypothetical protein